jgi:glutamate 5-kinase
MFDRVADDVHMLSRKNRVVLVTSGAIGFGVRALNLKARPMDVGQLQALAMIGQVGLLKHWQEAFDDAKIGQVLVTRHDLGDDTATQTLVRSIEAVWAYGAIPVVNENDAVSHEEISFGDNDQLAAEIAAVIHAECLVLLTDQDGVQVRFGTSSQRRVEVVNVNEMERYIVPTKSILGKGGFASKVIASRIALNAETDVYIGTLQDGQTIKDIITGKSGTRIVQ